MNNKTVLITGATSGIGKATAQTFAEENWNIIITGRRNDRLEHLKLKLSKGSNKVTSCCFDVRDKEACKNNMAFLDTENIEIDVLVNNAGLAKGFDPIHEGDLDDWETMIDTNIKGLLYMTRLISPRMVNKEKGHIINVGSIAGHQQYPMGNVYCATKSAVTALTHSMRLDLYKYGIKVSQVSPGFVEETEFAINRFDGDTEKAKIYEDFTPLHASDIAEIIYFIASRKKRINIQDVIVLSNQQASANHVNRSGRK